MIEMCFGPTERSVEANALTEGGDELDGFYDHTTCYECATNLGCSPNKQQSTLAAVRHQLHR